jgi:prephenate dehydrogenase
VLNKVVIFGVGLIGGSFARALKEAGAARHIVGVDRSDAFLARALELGVIDSAAETGKPLSDPQGRIPGEQAIAEADLILLAAPVAQTGKILSAIRPHLQPHTVVSPTW